MRSISIILRLAFPNIKSIFTACFCLCIAAVAYAQSDSRIKDKNKVKPHMISVLLGASALDRHKYNISVENTALGFPSSITINRSLTLSGLPLSAGLSYKAGNSDIYLGASFRFLYAQKSFFEDRISEDSDNQLIESYVKDLNATSFFSAEGQAGYSLHRLMRLHWLDIQSGIGLGYQNISGYFVDNTKTSLSGFRLALNLLQARALLHRHFFMFINNTLAFNFFEPIKTESIIGNISVKVRSMQYELSAGIGVSF